MSTVVEQEDTRVIPQSGKYTSSSFANIMTTIVFAFIIVIIVLLLWAIMSFYFGTLDFIEVAKQGFPKNPVRIENGQEVRIDFMYWYRWSFAGLVLALLLYFPTKWLIRTYGRQSLIITDDGITIKKFPKYKYFVTWDGILDVTVKPSDSVFTIFFKNNKKIVIYTMDRSVVIESLTLNSNMELSNRLKEYGDSLEERVIDFGYGAQIAVIYRRLKRSKVGVLGFFLVIFFLAVSIFAAAIVIVNPINTISSQLQSHTLFGFWNPNLPDFNQINQPPSAEHWFGTDVHGRDIFSRLLFGSFYSILIGVIATLISTSIGFFVGAASGYIGGTTDQIIQRLTEVLNSMPGLPVLLLISAAFTPLFARINLEGAYYLVVFSIFSLIGWGGIARIVRSEVLALKSSEFVQAERVLGATHMRIIRYHIMPNAMSTIIIFFTLGVAGNIIGVATLSFLGFGSNSTLVWGKDLSDAIANQPTVYWWGPTFISLSLFLLVLGFNLLGDSLRDALDPTLKE